MSLSPSVPLNNGVEIPQLGFGVWQIPLEETARCVGDAFELGYRHVDTAAAYRNERGVAAAVDATELHRRELFVTTKLQNSDQGYDSTLEAFDTSMKALDLDVLDLYLVHWPCPAKDRYLATWKAFEKLYADGRIRAIGVSNFTPAHLTRLMDASGVVPAVNQIECHPWLQQHELRAFHAEHGIVTEAWSPLAQAGDFLADPTVVEVAGKHGCTPAQAILRWHLDLGHVVFPKSVTRSRIEENFGALDVTPLDDEDLAAFAALDRGHRTGPDPDTFG